MVDPLLIFLKDALPLASAAAMTKFGLDGPVPQALQAGLLRVLNAPGLKSLIFGLIIILFIVFEPMGLDGRWQRFKAYLAQFPLYRPASARASRMFLKSERR
jgi:branched-chain amino acid transport system permease protein